MTCADLDRVRADERPSPSISMLNDSGVALTRQQRDRPNQWIRPSQLATMSPASRRACTWQPKSEARGPCEARASWLAVRCGPRRLSRILTRAQQLIAGWRSNTAEAHRTSSVLRSMVRSDSLTMVRSAAPLQDGAESLSYGPVFQKLPAIVKLMLADPANTVRILISVGQMCNQPPGWNWEQSIERSPISAISVG